MPNANAIKAGSAFVELSLKDGRLNKGLRAAQRRLKAFGSQARNVGAALTMAASIAALPLIGGVKAYADFEQQMASVSTMVQDTGETMDRFRDGVRSMSIEFGEPTETLAAGLYDILSASVPTESALDVLRVSAKSAAAGMTDTGTAADAITTVLNSYGMSADRAGDVSDWLFSIVAKGKTTFGQLAPNIGKVATIASSAGVPLEDLGAVIATLTRNGISTEESMTAVNAVISSFLKPGAEAVETANELGIEMNAAALRTQGLAGIFDQIKDLPPDVLARLFPNVRAIKGLLPALKNMEGFADDLDAMRNRADATDTAFEKMAGTLSKAFASVKQAGIAALSVVGESLAEPLKRTAKVIRDMSGRVIELVQRNRQLVLGAAKVIGIAAAAGAALIATGLAGTFMATVFGGLSAIVAGVGAVIGTLGSLLAGLLTPIGLIAAAVVGLGVYLLNATDVGGKAMAWLAERFEALRNTVTKMIGAIGDALAAGNLAMAARILWLTLRLEWMKGINVLNRYWLGFKEFFLSIATDAFFGALKLLSGAWHGMRVAWVETTSFMARAWAKFTATLGTAWSKAQGFVEAGIHQLMGLLDDEYDAEAAIAISEVNRTADQQQIEREKTETLNVIESKRGKDLARIGNDYESELSAIQDQAKEEHAQRRRAYQQDNDEAEKRLSTARREWQDAIAEAANARVEIESKTSGGGGGGGTIDSYVQRIREGLASIEGMPGRVADTVRGTFNAAALLSLQTSGDAAERTAVATEQTARNTRRIEQEVRDGGLAFT